MRKTILGALSSKKEITIISGSGGTGGGVSISDPFIRTTSELIITGDAISGFNLTPVAYEGLNLNGAPITRNRRWFKDGSPILGQTGTGLPTAALNGVGGVITAEEILSATLADGDIVEWIEKSNALVAVVGQIPQFTTQPTITQNPRVGDLVTLTLGAASGGSNIIVEVFLNGALDIRGQLTLLSPGVYTWNSAGAPTGTLTFRTRATNTFGSTLSNPVTSSLIAPVVVNSPSAFADTDWTLTDNPSASGNHLTEAILRLPYNGGAPISSLQRRINSGSPVEITPIEAGSRDLVISPAAPGVPVQVELRARNSANANPNNWSLPKLATPTIRVIGSDPLITDVEALFYDENSRGLQAEPIYQFGVDTPPTGWSYNAGTRTVRADGVCQDLIGWDTMGAQIQIGASARINEISACRFWEDFTRARISTGLMDLSPGAIIQTLAWSDFIGPGFAGGAGSLLRMNASGSGAAAVGQKIHLIERLAFKRMAVDGIKSTCGGIFRFIYIDTPQNLPYDPFVFDITKSYVVGDLVRWGPSGKRSQNYYKCVVNTVGNYPKEGKGSAALGDNTWWNYVDPHCDFINPHAVMDEPLEIYGCFFNRDQQDRLYGDPNGYGAGINNTLRFNKNNVSGGGTVAWNYKQATAHHNITSGGEELQSIPISFGPPGTTDGNNWEPQIVRDNWITPNQGGNMTFPDQLTAGLGFVFTNNVVYARGTAPVLTARYDHSFFGQSECTYILKGESFYRQIAPGPVDSDTALVAYLQNDTLGAAPTKLIINQSNVNANLVNPGLVACSNTLNKIDPGHTYRLLDWAVPGTGPVELFSDVNNASDGRAFSDLTSVNTLAALDGVSDVVIHYWWYNAPSQFIKNFSNAFSPPLLGVDNNGNIFPIGTNNPNMNNGRVDHFIFDRSGGTRGTVDSESRIAFMGPMPFKGDVSTTSEYRNFNTQASGGEGLGRIKQLDRGAWEAVKTFAAKTEVAPVFSHFLEGMHLIKFGDYINGVQSSGGATYIHPSLHHEMGQIRLGQLMAISMAMANPAANLTVIEPKFDGRALRDPTDPKKVRLYIDLGTADSLSTYAAMTGLADNTAMPHFQKVMGVELRKLGAALNEQRAIYRLDAGSNYPNTHKGVVTIEDNGATTGFAVILVEMLQDITVGDQFEFLLGGSRSAGMIRPRDDDAIYWMPLCPADYLNAGGTRPFRGLAVVSQPQPINVTQGGTVTPPPPPPPVTTWTVSGGVNQITIQTAPPVAAPVAAGINSNTIIITG